ncbi:MAG: DNA-processing protein DprA [Actinomycetota bacterium]|nr:DNA-processing protein DprA [Actinomycetota bacterium]
MSRREITPQDPEWPPFLSEATSLGPPQSLFLEGSTLEVGPKAIAVVGTRRPTAAGVEAAERLTQALVEAGFVIVSGMALGIDTIAHRTALRCGGKTVAVLGTGLDVVYPRRNEGLRDAIAVSGTIVTEFPLGTQPLAYHFPKRNRIVAGMSQGVLVVEGGLKSGALITARQAIDANRSVWAVPGSSRNPMADGPNELIRTGQAALVTDVNHMFEEIAPSMLWREKDELGLTAPDLNSDEAAILQSLDDVPLPLDRLVKVTQLPLGTAALAISRLEIRGLATRRGPGYEISQSGGRVRNLLMAQTAREDP